jgi:hypothetical protein
MVMQTMIELANPFDAYARKLGDCLVLFLIAGSVSCNPQFIVRIKKSGDLRTVDQNDLKVYGNPGDSSDTFIPKIPDDWK